MFMNVTHYPNDTLAELHDAGLLFFGHRISCPEPYTTVGGPLKWNNTEWAYTERKKSRLCQFFVNVEE